MLLCIHDNAYFKLPMHFHHGSQKHVRSLSFLEGTLDREALSCLTEQMSGQTDTIHNKWSPGEEITKEN
jgi:hypothetical protein